MMAPRIRTKFEKKVSPAEHVQMANRLMDTEGRAKGWTFTNCLAESERRWVANQTRTPS